ncbi:DUF4405 domain-containing protein [Schinkia azotoformans]|uniref:Flavinylation-associated cytochrome domain-containing protein n=1 Tax=Schinkia azotoformans LMG 9581 TaxID=1131731 RepID=K6DI00_SCHAZ|nr:DUF4405 domain-containing protein [Schinkia azotoformans]EKN67929.1 hypothetical protein BAZO_06939 [Schinkia azotoformans LMG 9581]MEC1637051.1 DUF4405 domain-containing protein [Schinkia azotoformans]MEC1723132.1 DUF4405 domain-containing protein [Schinkia azotoformans]MEC1945504.1 DUF4405 domain-containing protein [Schinkia azotoformans]MED4351348.1 DUF4405 domain-containing protein [Schinkia azotoformans]
MKKSNYVKFGLDIIMAVIFVLFFNKRVLGGLAFHEIAGIAIAATFFTHVLLNWTWVKKVTMKLFDRNLPFKTKLGCFLNVLLLISMAFIIISGILVSKVVFPNIDIGNDRWFEMSHITISFLVLILVAVHVGLHWNWIMNVLKKIFSIKAPIPLFSLLVKFATVALLVFGGYQIFSSNFIMHLQGVPGIFDSSSSHFEGEEHFERFNNSEGDQKWADHQFDRHLAQDGERGFKRGNRHFESVNPLGVIGTYFSIMSVFIIITYYLDKIATRKRRSAVDTGAKL